MGRMNEKIKRRKIHRKTSVIALREIRGGEHKRVAIGAKNR